MSGHKIIEGLKAAIAGDFSRVTIDGVTWVRARSTVPPEVKRARQKKAAAAYIKGDKGKLRRKLRRSGLKGDELDAAVAVAFPRHLVGDQT